MEQLKNAVESKRRKIKKNEWIEADMLKETIAI